jgi:hypothetical protein
VNLREQAEADLLDTLENSDGWGLPVILISPDGATQDKSANDATADLTGQILYDTTVIDPETGLQMIVSTPVVTLRRSSLTRVPVAGENWIVQIPETPDASAIKTDHVLARAPEGGKSIGFVRLYLNRVEQPS